MSCWCTPWQEPDEDDGEWEDVNDEDDGDDDDMNGGDSLLLSQLAGEGWYLRVNYIPHSILI